MLDAEGSIRDQINRDLDCTENVDPADGYAAALPNGARCDLCGALVHKNSVQFDHNMPRRDGGSAALENARVSHPYCNSIKDHLVGTVK